MNPLKQGENAPLFTLLNQHNEAISLADFKGKKVLLYFYPKALTPGCTTQACNLRDSKQELEQLGVVIMGISPDNPKKLAAFEEKNHLTLFYSLMKITKLPNNSAFGAKKSLWAEPLTASIASAF